MENFNPYMSSSALQILRKYKAFRIDLGENVFDANTFSFYHESGFKKEF